MRNRVRTAALIAAMVTLPSVAMAQDPQFKVGSKVLSAGVLLADQGYGGFGFGGAFEVGVAEIASMVRLGVGVSAGYLTHDYGYVSSNYSVHSLPIAGFVNGHYQIEAVPALDVYGGATVGFTTRSYSFDNGYSAFRYANTNDFIAGVHVGARYEFAPMFAAAAEVGGGSNVPWVFGGIAIKF